jgi:hypothetical protein
MSEGVVRTASAPVAQTQTPAGDTTTSATEHEASLFATYEDDQKHPYVADYFGVPDVWDKEEGFKNELRTIEGYLREKVTKGDLSNKTKDVQKYLQEFEKKAGTNPYENTHKRISQILAYIDFRKVIDS